MIIDHFETLSEKPVLNIATYDELRKHLDCTLPEHPTAFGTVLSIIRDHIFDNIAHADHPQFFAP